MGAGKGTSKRVQVSKADFIRVLPEAIKAIDKERFPVLRHRLTHAWRNRMGAVLTGGAADELSELLGTPEGVGFFDDVGVLFNQLRAEMREGEARPCIRIEDCVLEGIRMRNGSLGLNLGTMKLKNVEFRNCDLRSAILNSSGESLWGVKLNGCLVADLHSTHYNQDKWDDKDFIAVRVPGTDEYVPLNGYLDRLAVYEPLVQERFAQMALRESVGEKVSF